MKKMVMLVFISLFSSPVTLIALDTQPIVENFDDLADAGMASRALELAKTGGEYALAFTVGFVGYLILCATSVTVRKKSADLFERIKQATAQLYVRDSMKKGTQESQSDC